MPNKLCEDISSQSAAKRFTGHCVWKAAHEFHETCHSVTFYFMKKDSKWCCDTTTPESIHTKDESKRGWAFAFIFGVNWLVESMKRNDKFHGIHDKQLLLVGATTINSRPLYQWCSEVLPEFNVCFVQKKSKQKVMMSFSLIELIILKTWKLSKHSFRSKFTRGFWYTHPLSRGPLKKN